MFKIHREIGPLVVKYVEYILAEDKYATQLAELNVSRGAVKTFQFFFK